MAAETPSLVPEQQREFMSACGFTLLDTDTVNSEITWTKLVDVEQDDYLNVVLEPTATNPAVLLTCILAADRARIRDNIAQTIAPVARWLGLKTTL